jgi:hypothetical protein
LLPSLYPKELSLDTIVRRIIGVGPLRVKRDRRMTHEVVQRDDGAAKGQTCPQKRQDSIQFWCYPCYSGAIPDLP